MLKIISTRVKRWSLIFKDSTLRWVKKPCALTNKVKCNLQCRSVIWVSCHFSDLDGTEVSWSVGVPWNHAVSTEQILISSRRKQYQEDWMWKECFLRLLTRLSGVKQVLVSFLPMQRILLALTTPLSDVLNTALRSTWWLLGVGIRPLNCGIPELLVMLAPSLSLKR